MSIDTRVKINSSKKNYQHHTVKCSNLLPTRNRFRSHWVSSGMRKKLTIIKMRRLIHKRFVVECKMMMQFKATQYSNTYIKGVLFTNILT